MDYAAWAKAFEVNTIAPFRITTAFQRNLQRSKSPRVVTLSSQMGSLNSKNTGSIAYRSSKAAVNKVMQVLAHEFEAIGITVCAIHPGCVRTDMGGNNADIAVEECGAGILKFVDQLNMSHTGQFWTWEGEKLPW